jgi:hypothetical protein
LRCEAAVSVQPLLGGFLLENTVMHEFFHFNASIVSRFIVFFQLPSSSAHRDRFHRQPVSSFAGYPSFSPASPFDVLSRHTQMNSLAHLADFTLLSELSPIVLYPKQHSLTISNRRRPWISLCAFLTLLPRTFNSTALLRFRREDPFLREEARAHPFLAPTAESFGLANPQAHDVSEVAE